MLKILFLALAITQVTSAADVVVVKGQGKINVTPNMAICEFGIETKSKEAVVAQRENAKIADKVIQGVRKKFKLDNKDIVTTSFRVHSNYEYRNNTRVFEGYVVNNVVQVKLADSEKLGELLDYLTTNGVNMINSISFTHNKYDELVKEALKLSVTDAKEKASMLAKQANRSLGKVLHIVEAGANYNPPTPMFDGGMRAKMEMSALAATPIQSGELEITSGVQITYEIE